MRPVKKSKTGPKPKAKGELLVAVHAKIHPEELAAIKRDLKEISTVSTWVRAAIRSFLGLCIIACGSTSGPIGEHRSPPQFSDAGVADAAPDGNGSDSSPPDATADAAPSDAAVDDTNYVSSKDVNLREALRVPVARLQADGYPMSLRVRCLDTQKCTEAFYEGIPGPVFARVACPKTVPLRRELSVDASLTGDRLTDTLEDMLRIAVGAEPGCVETEEAFRP